MGLTAVILSAEILHFIVTDVSFSLQNGDKTLQWLLTEVKVPFAQNMRHFLGTK